MTWLRIIDDTVGLAARSPLDIGIDGLKNVLIVLNDADVPLAGAYVDLALNLCLIENEARQNS